MAEQTVGSFNLKSFSGCDMQVFAKFDYYDQEAKETIPVTVKLGTLSAISGATRVQVKPRIVIGEEDPIGVSTGTRLTSGNLRFEVLDESWVNAMQSASFNGKDNQVKFKFGDRNLIAADQLPALDIVVTAVSETNPNQKAMRVIRGVVITSQGSAIGMDSLAVQETYEFVASSIDPLKPVVTE